MTDQYNNFDVLSHAKEEVEKFQLLENTNREALMICIVFQAFAIEAFVNLVAVNLYSEENFFGKFERKSTMGKINKIFSEKLNADFEKQYCEIKDLMKMIFDLRDALAHYKSRRIDLEEMQRDPMNFEWNPYQYMYDHYEKIDDVITGYGTLKLLVNSLLGYDIFQTQMKSLTESLQFNINEMLRKGLGIELPES